MTISPIATNQSTPENIDTVDAVLRQHAEQQYAEELAELGKQDTRQRPPNWKLSPWAVKTYLMGGTLENGFVISPKYIGNGIISYQPVKNLSADFIYQYVGSQYLDNTQNNSRKLNAYSLCNLRFKS